MKENTEHSRGGFRFLLGLCAVGSVLLVIPSALSAPSASAATAAKLPLDEFITKVQSSYHDVRAIRADFIQTYDAGGAARVESGTVVFAQWWTNAMGLPGAGEKGFPFQ